jgi:hypothetical protein
MVWGIVIGPTGCTDFVITKLSSTSVLRAQRKKVSTASAPSLTMASPARLNEVSMMAGTPVKQSSELRSLAKLDNRSRAARSGASVVSLDDLAGRRLTLSYAARVV